MELVASETISIPGFAIETHSGQLAPPFYNNFKAPPTGAARKGASIEIHWKI